MTIVDMQEKIANLRFAIKWNNVTSTCLENSIVLCEVKDCFSCDVNREDIAQLQENNKQYSDTIAYLLSEIEIEKLPAFHFCYTANESYGDCIIHAHNATEALKAFISTHNDYAVLLSYYEL